jgi:hypothetical protein
MGGEPALMRSWLLILLVTLPLLAQGSPTIATIAWGTPETSDGQRFKARVVLTGPAGPGGANVIFEPTFHLELPTQVVVPAGQTSVEFPVKVFDDRMFSNYGFRSLTDVTNGGFSDRTMVTAICGGQTWEGPGPQVVRQ